MSKYISIDEVESIDCSCYDNEKLEVFIVRLVHIIYAHVGIVCVPLKAAYTLVYTLKVFFFESNHVGVIVVDKIANTSQRTINNRNFPSMTIVYLTGSRYKGEKQGLGRIMSLNCCNLGRLGLKKDGRVG